MATISNLSVKTLAKVLAHLKGGSIGFDVFRDDRTNNKAKLLAYIVQNHANSDIIAAITAVTGDAEISATTDAAQSDSSVPQTETPQFRVRLRYLAIGDTNERQENFKAPTAEEAKQRAHQFIHMNASIRPLGLDFLDDQGNVIPAPRVEPTVTTQEIKIESSYSPPAIAKGKIAETSTADDKLEALKKLLAPTIDESKIHAIMDARAQDYVDSILEATNKRFAAYDEKIDGLQFPVTVHVLKTETKAVVDLGHQHKNFATLLKMSQAKTRDGNRLNIWLKGPAGSGKTTAAKKVSEALGLQFQFNGAISTEYELMGFFKDASGTYHRTAFREVFEHGGVYLFDEVDSSLPKAVLAFNAALANGKCRFPDAMMTRHADAVIIAGANTAGNGANSDYVGRMKQDLAFLNRFVMLDWPLDEALEKALAANKDWCRKVQRFRSNAQKRSIKGHIISPRATFYGEALLAQGLDEEIVEQAVLRGALTDDQWGQLCQ